MGDVIKFPIKCRICRERTVPDDRRGDMIPSCLACVPVEEIVTVARPADDDWDRDLVREAERAAQRLRNAREGERTFVDGIRSMGGKYRRWIDSIRKETR